MSLIELRDDLVGRIGIFLSAIFLSAGIRQENGRQENGQTERRLTFETVH